MCHIVQNLEEGERYHFRIIARTAVIVSKPSEETDFVHVRQQIGIYHMF